jgi:hypothetical protein
LETASIGARLQDGTEVMVDVSDLRKALEGNRRETEEFSEAAE